MNHLTLYPHDCRRMHELPDESVHCVVTSPPYWSLRKYHGEQELIWGGKPDCEHVWADQSETITETTGNWQQAENGEGLAKGKHQTCFKGDTRAANVSKTSTIVRATCQDCGAWRGALGLEPTPEAYIAHLVSIFREVRRVLRSDGTCWINCGDSMWGGGNNRGNGAPLFNKQASNRGTADLQDTPQRQPHGTIKSLDRVGIPEQLVLALRADGWYWRSTIIWDKPNPMPESVAGWRWMRHRVKMKNNGRGKEASRNTTEGRPQQDHDGKDFKPDGQWRDCPGCPTCAPNDGLVLRKGSWRPTDSFEYIYQLTKTKDYYSDQEAVREAHSRDWWNETVNITGRECPDRNDGGHRQGNGSPAGRNLRSVWTFPSEAAYSYGNLEHFAAFPERLPETCIKASTPEVGVCPKCGGPWARVVESQRTFQSGSGKAGNKPAGKWVDDPQGRGDLEDDIRSGPCVSTQTLSWRATCACGLPMEQNVGATVLDPFAGTGTTLWVARKLGRQAIGYEISENYVRLIQERNRQGVL